MGDLYHIHIIDVKDIATMELLATGNNHCSLDILYGDVSLNRS